MQTKWNSESEELIELIATCNKYLAEDSDALEWHCTKVAACKMLDSAFQQRSGVMKNICLNLHRSPANVCYAVYMALADAAAKLQ